MAPSKTRFQHVQIAAMWLFLAPLIIILGTLDLVTQGRSKAWI